MENLERFALADEISMKKRKYFIETGTFLQVKPTISVLTGMVQ